VFRHASWTPESGSAIRVSMDRFRAHELLDTAHRAPGIHLPLRKTALGNLLVLSGAATVVGAASV
jgi:hypothetical protein